MRRLSVFLAIILALFSHDSIACKISADNYDLKFFLLNRQPGQVVFLGKVISIDSVPSSEFIQKQKIHFRVSRWWRGQIREDVIVIGVQGTMKGTTCEGVFDFSAQVGQEFLIAGYEKDGEIKPTTPLSKAINDGEQHKNILQLLDENR